MTKSESKHVASILQRVLNLNSVNEFLAEPYERESYPTLRDAYEVRVYAPDGDITQYLKVVSMILAITAFSSDYVCRIKYYEFNSPTMSGRVNAICVF